MSNYKLSNYVYTDNKEDGIVAFFNTKSLTMVKMSSETYDNILWDIDNGRVNPDDRKIQYLIDGGYIVKNDEDDFREVELAYINTCHSNDQLMLTILPTEGCNFRCEYCYEEHKQNAMSKEMQDALIKFVKQKIRSYRGLYVEWFGGEPLIYPETIEYLSKEFIKICKEHHVPYNAGMTSNGYLLDYNMFLRMKKCRVISYQITLDGLPETHNSQRFLANGGPTFETIIRNLKEIKEKEKSRLIHFDIRTNVTKKILPTYPEFVKFLQANLLDDKRFKQQVRIAWNGTADEEKSDNYLSSWLEMTSEDATEQGNKAIQKIRSCTDVGELKEQLLSGIFPYYPCYAAKANSLIIGPDGRVFKCTVHFDDLKEGVVGKLNKNGNIEFDAENMNKWITRSKDVLDNKCYRCVIYPICFGVTCPYKSSIRSPYDGECIEAISKILTLFHTYSFNDTLCKNIDNI